MKNKKSVFSINAKTWFVCLFMFINVNHWKAVAQQKFELGIQANSGYYVEEDAVQFYGIYEGIIVGGGAQVKYLLNTKTKVGLGLDFNYVKLSDKLYRYPEPIMPNLNTLEIPISIERYIIKGWFLSGAILPSLHISPDKPFDNIFLRYNLGTGYRFNRLSVSVNYASNFKSKDIKIETVPETVPEGFGAISGYKRQTVFLKLEYTLWKF